MSAADLRSIRRRFYLLLSLRFVPTGLFVTVFVLLMLERGLSLAQIGLGTAAQGVVMLFLELPSGGLADALGRKPVLILATLFSIAAMSLLLVADTVWLLAIVSALQGVFRALDSGPLEAWFIDASLAADRDVDIERGLSRQNVVICTSIGLGAMLGGLIGSTDGVFDVNPLVVPIALGLVLQVVGLVAIITLMHEVRAGERLGRGPAVDRDGADVVRGAVRLIRASSLLTALVVAELLWGFGMIAFEVFLPPRLAQVSGGVEEADSAARPGDHRGVGAVGGGGRVRPVAGAAIRVRRSPAAPCGSCRAAPWWRWASPPGRPASSSPTSPTTGPTARRRPCTTGWSTAPSRRAIAPRSCRPTRSRPRWVAPSAASSSAPSPTPPASPPPCSSPASSSPPPARCTWWAARPPAPPAPPRHPPRRPRRLSPTPSSQPAGRRARSCGTSPAVRAWSRLGCEATRSCGCSHPSSRGRRAAANS